MTRAREPIGKYYAENIDVNGVFRVPAALPSLCVRRGRSVAEVTAVAPDLSGLIVLLSCVASKRTVDVLSGSVAKLHDGRLLVSLFVDYTDSGMSIGGMEQCLAGLGVVEKVSLNGALAGGVAVNHHLFPLMMGDKRAVVFAVDYFREMLDQLRERLGEAANVLLYDMGRRYGVTFARQVGEDTGLNRDGLVKMALAEVQAAGWCIASSYLADPSRRAWRVSVRELFECSKTRIDGGVNQSHFFRGFIAGLFGEVFGAASISCVETLCAGNRADLCEFAVWV